MSNGQVVRVKKRSRGSGYVHVNTADDLLAAHLPELSVPRMNESARAAFRAVLDYEVPPANGSLVDFLGLAEARGFCAHPSDWIPRFDKDPRHPPLYQPWIDWMSENGVTPFHEGNTLTKENWDRWKPRPRLDAFKNVLMEDPRRALDLLNAVGAAQSAATRMALLQCIDAGGSFAGNYPNQVPHLRFFWADRSAKISTAAEEKLKNMGGLMNEEAHAVELAKHLKVSNGVVSFLVPPAPHTCPFWKYFHCTTFDLLAKALGLSPQDLARQADLKDLGSNFRTLVSLTGDTATRSIIATRVMDLNEDFESDLKEAARPLWERELKAAFKSEYWHTVGEFLGRETGTLNAVQMRELSCFQHWEQTVTTELETGGLPVNLSYDPLRAVALVVDKDAAREVLDKAISLGMKADNPRLTMLKFNLAL